MKKYGRRHLKNNGYFGEADKYPVTKSANPRYLKRIWSLFSTSRAMFWWIELTASLRRRLYRYIVERADLKEKDLVLDLGCGSGQILKISNRSFKVIGADLSISMLGQARTRGGALLLCQADAQAIPFKDNTFDSLISLDLLEYLPTPLKVVEEMVRVLKPAGKIAIVITCPGLGYRMLGRVEEKLNTLGISDLKRGMISVFAIKPRFRANKFSGSSSESVPRMSVKKM